MRVLAWGVGIVVAGALTGAAHADSVIVDHYLSNDPTTESPAWTLTTSGGTTTGSGGDDGQPHWEIAASVSSYRHYTYTVTDAQIIDPDGWELTAILKAVHNVEPYNNDIMLQVDDSVNRWHFNFITSGYSGEGLYHAKSGGPIQIKAMTDIDTAYHTYRFVFVRGSAGGTSNPGLNTDDTIEVYVDGGLEGTVGRTDVLSTSGNQDLRFGDNSSGTTTSTGRWNFVEFKTLGGGLVSHWTGDNTPNDSVGSNHGTLNGGMGYNSSGKIGQAFSLDGTDDYVNAPDSASLDVGTDYTKHVWFKADVVSGTKAIFLQGDDDLQGGNNYMRVNSSVLSYGVRASGPITGPTTLSTDIWYQGCLTYDGGTIRLYLDGSEEVSGPTTINMNADSRIAIGAWVNPVDHNPHACCYFDGLIDDAALWDEALTADEVKSLYGVGNDATLAYGAGNFDSLKQIHDALTGSTTIGSLLWTYAANLSGSAGLSGSDPTYTLVLNDSFGVGSRTGLTSALATTSPAGTVITLN